MIKKKKSMVLYPSSITHTPPIFGSTTPPVAFQRGYTGLKVSNTSASTPPRNKPSPFMMRMLQ
jgi:hypothetical protein